jgi:hypothetical protein
MKLARDRGDTFPAPARTPILAVLALALLGCGSESVPGKSGTGGSPAGTGGNGNTGGMTGGGNRTGGTTGTGGTVMGSGGAAGGGQIALPLIVTTTFDNQGWFADAGLMAYFTPGSTVIRQLSSTAGPCAARSTPQRGDCLAVTYTPPAGLTQPAGGGAFVGVFLLTTLAMAHPEAMPPANAGDPNWGVELGKSVAPGARSISFQAASATDGLVVTFKAGTAADAFTLPEQPETLTTGWRPYALAIAGINYGTSVVGAFAWVLKDTSRSATFYLDGIVWE